MQVARLNLVSDDGVDFVIQTTNADFTEGCDAMGTVWREDEQGVWVPDDDSMTTAVLLQRGSGI